MPRGFVFAYFMLATVAALPAAFAQEQGEPSAQEQGAQDAAQQGAEARQPAPPAVADAYRDKRAALIAQGWKPDVGYGLKTASGKPLYRFPEMVCGPALCSAKWRDRAGAVQTISVLRGETEADYRLAPQ